MSRSRTMCLWFASGGVLLSQTTPESELVMAWKQTFHTCETHYFQRDLPRAEQCFQSALAIVARIQGNAPGLGTTLSSLGTVLVEAGRISEGEQATSDAVKAFRACGSERCGPGLATSIHNLAMVYMQQNRLFEAERLLREALSLFTRMQTHQENIANVLDSMGWLELNRRRPAAAEVYFRRALLTISTIDSVNTTRALLYSSLSSALLRLNRERDAMDAGKQAFAAARGAPEMEPLRVVAVACTFAKASSAMRDYDLAEETLVKAQEILASLPEVEPRELGVLLDAFGEIRYIQKRYIDAARLQSKALEILGHHLSPSHPQMIQSMSNYASTLRRLKQTRKAKEVEQELRTAGRLRAEDPGSKHRISVSDLQRRP